MRVRRAKSTAAPVENAVAVKKHFGFRQDRRHSIIISPLSSFLLTYNNSSIGDEDAEALYGVIRTCFFYAPQPW